MRDVIISEKLRHKAVVFNFSGLKSVFEKLGFHVGQVWAGYLTVVIKQSFRIPQDATLADYHGIPPGN